MSHFSHNESKVSEQNIYGAGRIGLINADKYNYANGYTALDGPKYTNKLGLKNYELTNHLGNVNAVITDRKMLDADYSLGVWHDFSSSISWTTVSGTPSINYSGNELNYGTATATTAASYRTEATVGSKTYSFSLDISDRNAVSNFSIELYKNNTNDLVTPTLLKTFTTGELVNGTTISYTYTTAASGDDYFVYKLVKTSTESAYVKLDNLKFKKSYSRYKAVVIMKADYYPYGMVMPGRKWNNGDYRYGYNGMEQDIELKGNGNSYTTEFRQYDPRLGRWMSLDPMMAKFPSMSPYLAFNNNPVYFVDPMGLEGTPGEPEKKTKDGGSVSGAGEGSGKTLDEVEIKGDRNRSKDGGSPYTGLKEVKTIGNQTINVPENAKLKYNRFGTLRGISYTNPYNVDEEEVYKGHYSLRAKGMIYIQVLEGAAYETQDKYSRPKVLTNGGFFANETDAYEYMWKNTMYKSGNVNSEQVAYITERGVWVCPNVYASNGSSPNLIKTTTTDKKTYINGVRVLAQLHTHPQLENTGFGGFSSNGDYGNSESIPYMYSMVMEFTNIVRIMYYNRGTDGYVEYDISVLPKNMTTAALCSGAFKLIPYLKTLQTPNQ